MPLFANKTMEEVIEVCGSEIVFSTQKPPPYNPLRRPKISYKKPIIALILFVLGIVLLCFWPEGLWLKKWIVLTGFVVLYLLCILKKAIIWGIHLYQNKASDKTRLRCVFEPSCSEYMILAIEKYGTVVGIAKGIKRLLRCHPPNGGVDYP